MPSLLAVSDTVAVVVDGNAEASAVVVSSATAVSGALELLASSMSARLRSAISHTGGGGPSRRRLELRNAVS